MHGGEPKDHGICARNDMGFSSRPSGLTLREDGRDGPRKNLHSQLVCPAPCGHMETDA
jgi:hypothetical protein